MDWMVPRGGEVWSTLELISKFELLICFHSDPLVLGLIHWQWYCAFEQSNSQIGYCPNQCYTLKRFIIPWRRTEMDGMSLLVHDNTNSLKAKYICTRCNNSRIFQDCSWGWTTTLSQLRAGLHLFLPRRWLASEKFQMCVVRNSKWKQLWEYKLLFKNTLQHIWFDVAGEAR